MLESAKRDRNRPIKVYVSDQERQEIERKADSVCLPASTLMRNLVLGFIPRSTFDQQAMHTLIRLHADQGRLGGLLKLWLTQRKWEAVSPEQVRALLKQIEHLQVQLVQLVMAEKRRQ